MIETTTQTSNFREIVAQSISSTPVGRIKDIAYERPIIIGGCGSSGTTLLKTMLDSHKNIACGHEISFFDHPRLFSTGKEDLHRMFLEQDFSDLTDGLIVPIKTQYGDTFGLFVPNSGRLYHDFAKTNQMFEMAKDIKHFINLFLSNFADISGKKRWAEKTPNNIFCIKEIMDFFPDAKFVHVIRDGRDTALSLHMSRGYDLISAVIRWILSIEAGIRHRGNPRYYEIRYEDLVLDTKNTLRELMDFLEDDYDPSMLNFEEAGKDNPMNYGSTPIFTKSIGKWKRNDMDPTKARILDLALKDLLKKLDYETN
jgi:hypothetical protein